MILKYHLNIEYIKCENDLQYIRVVLHQKILFQIGAYKIAIPKGTKTKNDKIQIYQITKCISFGSRGAGD